MQKMQENRGKGVIFWFIKNITSQIKLIIFLFNLQTPRRKKKIVHQTAATDDKKLQVNLVLKKKLRTPQEVSLIDFFFVECFKKVIGEHNSWNWGSKYD